MKKEWAVVGTHMENRKISPTKEREIAFFLLLTDMNKHGLQEIYENLRKWRDCPVPVVIDDMNNKNASYKGNLL